MSTAKLFPFASSITGLLLDFDDLPLDIFIAGFFTFSACCISSPLADSLLFRFAFAVSAGSSAVELSTAREQNQEPSSLNGYK
jgi:hypothetical protein